MLQLQSTNYMSVVTVTHSEISKSVTITDCHSNSVTLIVLNESGIAKTVTVADFHSNRCHSNRRPLYFTLIQSKLVFSFVHLFQ